MKRRVNHPQVVRPSPHVSAAIVCEGVVYLSGQGPLDMATRSPVRGSIEEETQLTLDNIEAILVEAGCTRNDILKCTCYLGALEDFSGFDAVYQRFFSEQPPPARTTVQSALLRDIKVEIDVIARLQH